MRFIQRPVPIDYRRAGLETPATPTGFAAYFPDNFPDLFPEAKRPAVVICPGGGYRLTSSREGEVIAFQFLAADIAAVVLYYAVAPDRYPTALFEVASTICWLRDHAEQFHIDPDRISVCGFSAGGHLAASISNQWNCEQLSNGLGYEPVRLQPNSAVLCYPVISGDAAIAHQGSLENLYGHPPTDEERAAFSLERQVGPHTPPTLLWHTEEDQTVPWQNSLRYADALTRHQVPHELHIYPYGAHGISLGTPSVNITPTEQTRPVQEWIRHAVRWVRTPHAGHGRT